MFNWIIKTIVGGKNTRELRRIQPIVRQINEIEQKPDVLSDDDLRAKTAAWKQELSAITDADQLAARLDEILPEAFARGEERRPPSDRAQTRLSSVCDQPLTWNMVHFDVQLIGGMILHRGRISEMATGEGKTLVATAPVYLNALTGRGVHVVTVNDYLARRDAEWMGQLYQFLGLTVGMHPARPVAGSPPRAIPVRTSPTARTASSVSTTCVTTAWPPARDQQVQRGHYFAIVDEVDSILIDEARTPLIISGPVATVSARTSLTVSSRSSSSSCAIRTRSATASAPRPRNFSTPGKKRTRAAASSFQAAARPASQQRALLRAMEDPEMRRALREERSWSFYKDTEGKARLVDLKEELSSPSKRRQHDADLSQLGRDFLNPNDPDAFVLPDLLTDLCRHRQRPAAQRRREGAEKGRSASSYRRRRPSAFTTSASSSSAYCLYEKDVEYVVEENKVIIVDDLHRP